MLAALGIKNLLSGKGMAGLFVSSAQAAVVVHAEASLQPWDVPLVWEKLVCCRFLFIYILFIFLLVNLISILFNFSKNDK